MPLPSSSPVYDAKPSHYASPVKFESNSLGPASPPPSSSKKERRHKKKYHHSSRKRSEAPLTWKEQLVQLGAILLTAAVVYKLTFTAVGWLEESRRPFCGEHQDIERGAHSFPSRLAFSILLFILQYVWEVFAHCTFAFEFH